MTFCRHRQRRGLRLRQTYRRSELAEALVGTNAFGYAYDTIGNRTSDTLNGMSRNYAANCLNQYAQIDAAQMVYDTDGNLVRDDRFAYAYDAENRMLSARPIAPSEGDLAVVNAYDHKHRRVMKRVERFDGDEWQTSETHAFTYDGSNIVLERIAFADGTTRTVEYFWGNDLSGTDSIRTITALFGNTFIPTLQAPLTVTTRCAPSEFSLAV